MASVAALFNVPGTANELAAWSFNHMAHHRDILRLIYQQRSIAAPEYPLDPWTFDAETLLYQHQAMHNTQNAILGISGNNLVDVDWRDPPQRSEWVRLNALEHQQAGSILGV